MTFWIVWRIKITYSSHRIISSIIFKNSSCLVVRLRIKHIPHHQNWADTYCLPPFCNFIA